MYTLVATATLVVTGTMSPINGNYLEEVLHNQIAWGHIPPDSGERYDYFFALRH